MSTNIVTAGFLIIGNEILSGKTQDVNLASLAKKLNLAGVRLMEVRVVLDIESDIIDALKAMSLRYNYVFTSGGIGPTHDDITTECVAKCFNTALHTDANAYAVLTDFYKARGDELNEGRAKMAIVPVGAELIANSVSAAPGFKIHNVFVMAGVPKIFNVMLEEAIRLYIKGGAVMISKSIDLRVTEGKIASQLKEIQKSISQVEIGSYPKDGYTQIVVAGYHEDLIDKAIGLVAMLTSNQD
jgi:molybdenum cofactor synthesis domain-containing protein